MSGSSIRSKRSKTQCVLPNEPQSELDVAAVGHRSDGAFSRLADIAVGQTEIRMIENVEEFCPKLHVQPFREPIVFAHAEIEIPEAGAIKSITRCIALRADGRLSERCQVEPHIGCWIVQFSVANAVRILRNERTRIVNVRRCDAEWTS